MLAIKGLDSGSETLSAKWAESQALPTNSIRGRNGKERENLHMEGPMNSGPLLVGTVHVAGKIQDLLFYVSCRGVVSFTLSYGPLKNNRKNVVLIRI